MLPSGSTVTTAPSCACELDKRVVGAASDGDLIDGLPVRRELAPRKVSVFKKGRGHMVH
jgi:hypothetical protein